MIIVWMSMAACSHTIDIDNEILTPEDLYGDELFSFAGWPLYIYNIKISITDNLGNDLTVPLAEEQWIKPAPDADRYTYPWSGGINPSKYNLDLELSHPDVLPHDIPGVVYYNNNYPVYELILLKYNNYQLTDYSADKGKYYLSNTFGYSRIDGLDILLASGIDDYIKDNPQQDYIIYKISCPTIFGDNKVHVLTTYWGDDLCFPSDNPEAEEQWKLYPNCKKALFDGQEVLVKTIITRSNEFRDEYNHFIEIVLGL